jgi:hypothetical protein
MINEKECTKILNSGQMKFSKDEVKLVRDLTIQLATIQYENFNENSNVRNLDYERDLLQTG